MTWDFPKINELMIEANLGENYYSRDFKNIFKHFLVKKKKKLIVDSNEKSS